MGNIGFAAFGRPTGQEVKANGFFLGNRLTETLYLEGLTGGITLDRGQSLAVIRRHDSPNSPSVWAVALFEYAESYGHQNRPGGFVGAAVCFSGIPHSGLINQLLQLQAQMLKEVDGDTRRFLSARKEDWKVELPAIDERLVTASKLPQYALKKDSRIAVASPGHLQLFLTSIVQGVVSNPSFHSQETVIASADPQVLEKVRQRGLQQFSIYQLLDYSAVHASWNQKLEDANKEIRSKAAELEARKREIAEEEEKKGVVSAELKQLEEAKRQLNDRIEGLRKQEDIAIAAKEKAQQELRKCEAVFAAEKTKQSHERNRNFQQVVINGQYRNELSSYVRKEVDKAREEWRYEQRERRSMQQRRAVPAMVATLVVLSMVVAGAGMWHWHIWPFSGKKSHKSNPKVENAQVSEPKKPNALGTFTATDLGVLLSAEDRSMKRREATIYIKEAKEMLAAKAFTRADTLLLLNQKWNFREIFPSEVDSIHKPISPVLELEQLYKDISGNRDWFFTDVRLRNSMTLVEKDSAKKEASLAFLSKWYFLLPVDWEQVEFTEYDFKTTKNKEIVKHYLKHPKNIYKSSGVSHDENEPDSALFTHFRWMVHRLSNHTVNKDKDIVTTGQKIHRVPMMKTNP